MLHFLDPLVIIKAIGILGVFAVIFAESGLFFGFFLPGDSLLFTAGLLASQHLFSIWFLVIGCVIAAIAGDSVGYSFGSYIGVRIFTREDSFFFRKKHVERSHAFYEKYGAKAIVLARFVPIVRTFAPILAGVGTMNYRKFLAYNAIGGASWVICLSGLGYFLGNSIPNIDHYILPIILLIILISFLPILYEYLSARKKTNSKH